MREPVELAEALERLAGTRATEGRLPVTPGEETLVQAAAVLRNLSRQLSDGDEVER